MMYRSRIRRPVLRNNFEVILAEPKSSFEPEAASLGMRLATPFPVVERVA